LKGKDTQEKTQEQSEEQDQELQQEPPHWKAKTATFLKQKVYTPPAEHTDPDTKPTRKTGTECI
jgi:hypothetical protein